MKPAVRSLAAYVVAGTVAVSSTANGQAQQAPQPRGPADPGSAGLSAPESAHLRSLQLRLDEVAGEQADTSTLLPWTAVALGVSAIALGVGIGLERVASCDESCSGPFWPAWVVVGGAGVASGGLVWLKLVEEDIAELRSRRFRLEMQIDGYETLRDARRDRALLHVGGRF